ncbi:MAG: pseudouridine synthase, partial [Actinomycetota bacterium]
TNSDPEGRVRAIDLVKHPANPRLYPVGRLDLDSSGLLLLTNDGELANRIAHPSHGVEKEYLATVRGNVGGGGLRTLRDGVELDDGMTAPAKVSQPEPGLLRITIHEGRNRQVRRMCEAIGHPVVRLVRVRIGPLRDAALRPGTWRELEQRELKALVESVTSPDRRVR